MSQLNELSLPVIDTLEQHVTIRRYKDKPIEAELLDRLLNAARRSPTSSNMQAYSLVVVRNQETKAQLAELAGGQSHVETCDTFVAVCADISRLEEACKMHDLTLDKNLENTLVSTVDAALVGMSLSNAAESVGLGTCMIGGIRNHPAKVAEVLDLPKGVYVVFGMTIGWPANDERPPQKPRMQEDLIIHREKYQRGDRSEALRAYDAQLAEHYQSQGRNTPDAAWTGIMAKRFSDGRRKHLRQTLEDLGFEFN